MAGITFDPEVIHGQVEALYQGSSRAVRNWTLVATFGGFVLGAALGGPWSVVHLGGVLVGAASGWVIGDDRRRRLRIEGQMLLCQLRVEENTRAWIAQSRLALTKLTAAVDKLADVEASAPAPLPVAAPLPAPTVAAPAAAPAVAPPRPATAASRLAPIVAPPSEPGDVVAFTQDDELPSWAAPEAAHPPARPSSEYLVPSPADELGYVADHDALDDDAWMRTPEGEGTG